MRGTARSAAPPMRYDPVALGLHWLVAGLVVAVVALGLAIPEAPRGGAVRALILLLHRSVGLTIFAVCVVRVLWRWRHAPPLPPSLAPVEAFLAHATHLVLYLVLLGMPVLGYVNAAASGHAVSLYGIVAIPPLIAPNGRLSQIAIALHLAGQFVVYGFVALHVAAALMHLVIRRDGVFQRMLPAPRAR